MTSMKKINKKKEADGAVDKTPKPDPLDRAKNTSESEEIGGPKGPEPTRFGDWESNGRCSDF